MNKVLVITTEMPRHILNTLAKVSVPYYDATPKHEKHLAEVMLAAETKHAKKLSQRRAG